MTAGGTAAAPAAPDVAAGHGRNAGAPPVSLEAEVASGALAAADALCARLAAEHYENFTVASRLLPATLRTHLARVYAFCRVTDDIGDELEGDRVTALRQWRAEVAAGLDGGAPPRHPVLLALRETAWVRAVETRPFLDLVDANLRDQQVGSYRSWDELLDYCRLSAAPVGRMVLAVAGCDGAEARALSDDVCIGLQLANFAQDVSLDAAKGRAYLLEEDIEAVGVHGAVRRHCDRAERLLASGERLERMVDGAVRLQLALYRRGGLAIVAAVRAAGYRTDERRPIVPVARKLAMVASGLPAVTWPRRGDGSHRVCAGIARRQARNFYVGFLALPGPQRGAIYALYAFARQVDDAVDGRPPDQARHLVAAQRQRLHLALAGEPDDPVTAALGRAVRRHAIPAGELEALIDGVEQDLTITRYATWDRLSAYCGLVASTIGRMCVRVFGFTDTRALVHADHLGAALQLTNILRDVREDFGFGRVYLPAEDLDRFGVDVAAALDGATEGWDALVSFEVERARALFISGLRVCDFVPGRAAVCVRTMAGIYRALLDEIDATPRLPLERRLSIPAARKLRIAAAAWR